MYYCAQSDLGLLFQIHSNMIEWGSGVGNKVHKLLTKLQGV